MSKEYYKKQIIDLRASLVKEKEAKKKDNEYYARLIKGTSLASSKASYRKSKMDFMLCLNQKKNKLCLQKCSKELKVMTSA